MSCKECDRQQETNGIYYYRIETANIAVQGCTNHVGIMFNRLNGYDDLRSQRDELLAACELFQNEFIHHVDCTCKWCVVKRAIAAAKGGE